MKHSTKTYSGSKADVAVFVDDQVRDLRPGCALTMIILPEKSEDFFVTSATGEWLEDTADPEHSSDQLTNISQPTTQDG